MTGTMDKIQIPLGDYPTDDRPYTAMTATDRQAVLDLLEKTKVLHDKAGYFEITMPCGYSRKFNETAAIPCEDLPCHCGQVGHYLIWYKKEKVDEDN